MIKNALQSFGPAYRLILKDKVSFCLAAIPVIIGLLIYFFAGKFLFTSAIDMGQQYIEQYLSDGTLGKIVYYIVAGILTIMLYFIVNWTFVLFISVIASPFNDVLSSRIEKQLLNEKLPAFADSFEGGISKILPTILNELKKISLILVLTIVAVLFGYIPLLTPVSIFISIILISSEFLDFSWSRHGMEFKECKKDLRTNVFGYTVGGGFFLMIVALPVINVIVPSLATSYFTVLWVKNNEHRNQITK